VDANASINASFIISGFYIISGCYRAFSQYDKKFQGVLVNTVWNTSNIIWIKEEEQAVVKCPCVSIPWFLFPARFMRPMTDCSLFMPFHVDIFLPNLRAGFQFSCWSFMFPLNTLFIHLHFRFSPQHWPDFLQFAEGLCRSISSGGEFLFNITFGGDIAVGVT
jgi:hypothetical protein